MLQAKEIQREIIPVRVAGEHYVAPKTVASLYGRSAFTIRRHCKRGDIPAVQVLGEWQIDIKWYEDEKKRICLNTNPLLAK